MTKAIVSRECISRVEESGSGSKTDESYYCQPEQEHDPGRTEIFLKTHTHTYVASPTRPRQGSSLGEKLRDSLGKKLGVWGGTCTNLVNNPII